MKMTKGLLMTALITGTLMSSTAAFAEELQEYTLDQMVVTATRYEKRDVEVAASTQVLDTKNLSRQVRRTCMTHLNSVQVWKHISMVRQAALWVI